MIVNSYQFSFVLFITFGFLLKPAISQGCDTNPCQNCGTCEPTGVNTHVCHCTPLFSGASCEIRLVTPENVRDCSEIGYFATNGVYNLVPTATGIRGPAVFCDMSTDGGSWTVFQRRIDGKVNFQRNWADYEKGFGYPNQEYWLGTSWLNLLISSSSTWELRIDMVKFDGTRAYAKYSDFKVADCSVKYRLESIGTYTGNASDSLSNQVGKGFSTADADNDVDASNCAQILGGGFWYSGYPCHTCNPNGVYRQPGTSYTYGIDWFGFAASGSSLKYIDMKIRPYLPAK